MSTATYWPPTSTMPGARSFPPAAAWWTSPPCGTVDTITIPKRASTTCKAAITTLCFPGLSTWTGTLPQVRDCFPTICCQNNPVNYSDPQGIMQLVANDGRPGLIGGALSGIKIGLDASIRQLWILPPPEVTGYQLTKKRAKQKLYKKKSKQS